MLLWWVVSAALLPGQMDNGHWTQLVAWPLRDLCFSLIILWLLLFFSSLVVFVVCVYVCACVCFLSFFLCNVCMIGMGC